MIYQNRVVRPAATAARSAVHILASSLTILALITLVTFSQQSHATNIWLWSWLGISGVLPVQDAAPATMKDSAPKVTEEAARASKGIKKTMSATNAQPHSPLPLSTKSAA